MNYKVLQTCTCTVFFNSFNK